MKYGWLYIRKNLILWIFYEIIIYFFIIFFQIKYFLTEFEYSSLFFLNLWILLSYILGRYINPPKVSDIGYLIKKNLYSSFLTFSMCLIINFLIKTFLEDTFLSVMNSFLFLFFFITFLSQIIINILFLNNLSKKIKWIFFGKEEILEYLKKEKEFADKNYHIDEIKEINFETIKSQYNSNLAGLIIDDKDFINKSQQREIFKIQRHGIKVLTPLMWCEKHLQNSPSQLINNNEFTKSRFSYFRVGTIQLRLKRVGDFLFSVFLLFITSPILLFASLLIYLQDFGPIIYKQKRTGLNGKNFYIYKLRSMKINSEKNGPQWSKKNDSRITPIGKLIRLTRVDELPQLICVLRGEMSLIGPRPERPEFDEIFFKNIPLYELRYFIKPGLSGWAQVNYPYGASENDAFIKLSYDLYYISHFSIFLDFLIVFKTIKTILNGKLSIPKSFN